MRRRLPESSRAPESAPLPCGLWALDRFCVLLIGVLLPTSRPCTFSARLQQAALLSHGCHFWHLFLLAARRKKNFSCPQKKRSPVQEASLAMNSEHARKNVDCWLASSLAYSLAGWTACWIAGGARGRVDVRMRQRLCASSVRMDG